jgi:CBS domain-containing protein
MTIARLLEGRTIQTVTCEAAMRAGDGVALLAERRIGALPVMDAGEVVGIFSERDLLYCIAQHGAGALDLLVGNVMTAPPITADPESTVRDALEVMTLRRIRHLPVLEGERLAAFVSIGDLVKYRLELVEHEAQAMRDYIRTA